MSLSQFDFNIDLDLLFDLPADATLTGNGSADAIPFANDTDHDETELEVVSSSSRYLPPIAPKPSSGPWPAGWIPPIDDFVANVPRSTQFGHGRGTELPPRRKQRVISGPRKPRRPRGTDLERLFTEGPNPYGRTGRKKCEKCRFHRVKCEFDENNPHSPCKRCISKRYACGEKSLGPKSQLVAETKCFEVTATPSFSLERPIGNPLDQLLLPNDSFYLQVYDFIFLQDVGSRQAMELSSPFLHNALVYRVDFDITSRPYRAAILALASLACLNPIDYRNGGNPDTNFYCAIYYRAAAEAIATKDVASLMYASYIMAILNCAYEPCSWTRLVHCAQFCRTVHAFLDDQVSERYRHWVLELWYSLVRIACEQYWFKRSRSFLFDIWWWHGYASTAPLSGVKCFTTRTVISFREEPNHEREVSTLMEIREISAPFIYLGCDTQIQIRNGLFDFHVLFENFLYQARNSESIRRVDSTRELLHDTIVHVITLIERLPLHGTLLHDWFRCYYAVTAKTTSWCDSVNSEETLVKAVDTILLYASSRMLVKLFSHDLDPNEADQVEACTSALATVHLIWSAREILSKTHPSLIRRTLFWAGLILYKANNSRGKDYIEQCIRSSDIFRGYVDWELFRKLFFGFMEGAQNCTSWNAIWTIEFERIGFMDFAFAFSPWLCTPETGFWEAQVKPEGWDLNCDNYED